MTTKYKTASKSRLFYYERLKSNLKLPPQPPCFGARTQAATAALLVLQSALADVREEKTRANIDSSKDILPHRQI